MIDTNAIPITKAALMIKFPVSEVCRWIAIGFLRTTQDGKVYANNVFRCREMYLNPNIAKYASQRKMVSRLKRKSADPQIEENGVMLQQVMDKADSAIVLDMAGKKVGVVERRK